MQYKDFQSIEEAAEKVLRSYLLRCYSNVSKQYEPIVNMSPEQGVEHLLMLKKEGKIKIELDSVNEHILCTITPIH